MKTINSLQLFTFSPGTVTKTLTQFGERQFLVSLWDENSRLWDWMRRTGKLRSEDGGFSPSQGADQSSSWGAEVEARRG